MNKPGSNETIKLERFVPGGQAIGRLASGKKVFAWGGLPGEKVEIQITKKKHGFVEGVAVDIIEASEYRVDSRDGESFLSTSPWQILDYNYELAQKSALIKEAFGQEKIEIDSPEIVTDRREYEYRNKMEYSFWWDNETERISLAFFRRGSHGKIAVKTSSLAMPGISKKATEIVKILNDLGIEARDLKTLLVRSTQNSKVVAQLYVKNLEVAQEIADKTTADDLEIIYSDPRSPASVITQRVSTPLNDAMRDILLDHEFSYSIEGFFQINLPVYELALRDIRKNINTDMIVDMYSGVGSIGLTISDGKDLTLVEVNDSAVTELRRNVEKLQPNAKIVHTESENALEFIDERATLIVDPPRAGLHTKVIERILEVAPPKVIYLSCNPTTQARDVKTLLEKYQIDMIKGYNFFPRTPHIESLVVLSRR